MNTRVEKLTAKVAAVNRANEYAARLYAALVEKFAPLVGQKILKVDGTLLAKYEGLVPVLPCSPDLHVYRHSSDYSLAWTVKTCEFMPPHSCMYHEVTVYVGDLRGATLEKMTVHPFTGRTDFSVEEITGKRLAYESAKKVADELRNDLYPFGEEDR
jgi:hypothetical protein